MAAPEILRPHAHHAPRITTVNFTDTVFVHARNGGDTAVPNR